MRYTNNHKLPESTFRVLTGSDWDPRRSEPNVIGLTSLIGPAKIRYLTSRHWDEMSVDALAYTSRIMGQGLHMLGATKHDKAETLSEERVYIRCEDWTVHTVEKGKRVRDHDWYNTDSWYVAMRFDLYEQIDETHGVIQDDKETSVWTVVMDGGTKPDWEWQLRLEAYALNKLGFPVTLCRNVLWLKDWSQREKTQKGAQYPDVDIFVAEYGPLPDSQIESYIKMRLRSHQEAMEKKDDEIPACTEDERWYKPGEYAVMKEGRVKAVKLFKEREYKDAKHRADGMVIEENMKKKGKEHFYVEYRPGKDTRCNGWKPESECPCREFCHFWKEKYGKKEARGSYTVGTGGHGYGNGTFGGAPGQMNKSTDATAA